MELEEYDYAKRPFKSQKVFDVYPLSRDGFNQYIGHDSYAHKYLNKITPKIFSEFYLTNSNQNNQEEIENLNSIENPKLNEESKQTNDNNIIYATETYKPINKQKIEEIYLRKEDKTNNNLITSTVNQNNFNKFLVKNIDKKNISESSKYKDNKFFLNNLTRKLHTSYNKKSNFKENDNFKNNFNFLSMNIKDSLSSSSKLKNLENHRDNESNKKKYDGFDSFNIPRLDKSKQKLHDPTKAIFQYTERLAKSCTGSKKFYNVNDEKMENIYNENEKLKTFFKMKILNNKVNFPLISYIESRPRLGLNKNYLGSQYKDNINNSQKNLSNKKN